MLVCGFRKALHCRLIFNINKNCQYTELLYHMATSIGTMQIDTHPMHLHLSTFPNTGYFVMEAAVELLLWHLLMVLCVNKKTKNSITCNVSFQRTDTSLIINFSQSSYSLGDEWGLECFCCGDFRKNSYVILKTLIYLLVVTYCSF